MQSRTIVAEQESQRRIGQSYVHMVSIRVAIRQSDISIKNAFRNLENITLYELALRKLLAIRHQFRMVLTLIAESRSPRANADNE